MSIGGSYVGRSRFIWEDLGDLVLVEDQYTDVNPSMTVTNDAESVVDFLAINQILAPGKPVVYRDTDGMWDELKYSGRRFTGFFPLRADSKEAAVNAIRQRSPKSGLKPHDTPADRIAKAIRLAVEYGGYGGSHHKAWTIDQMVRVLAGYEYEKVVREAQDGEDGPNTYTWDVGIAP